MTSIIFWLHRGFMEQVDKNHELEINWIFPKNCWLCVDWNTINWRGEDIDCACAVCRVKQSDVKWLLWCCCCCCCILSILSDVMLWPKLNWNKDQAGDTINTRSGISAVTRRQAEQCLYRVPQFLHRYFATTAFLSVKYISTIWPLPPLSHVETTCLNAMQVSMTRLTNSTIKSYLSKAPQNPDL